MIKNLLNKLNLYSLSRKGKIAVGVLVIIILMILYNMVF
jgi:hypothetical protein|tara:strand:+ start:1262 stop:1378 length:117 start_codon:yes stop_codon:yes gene_type:complete